MHDPREPHLIALKQILRYVSGTRHLGLQLRPSSHSDLVVYSDADWVGCPNTLKSISSYAVSSATISSPGPPSVRQQCLTQVQKQSIKLSPMQF